MIETIKKKRDAGLTWRRIAADLNGMGIKSLRGGPWHDTTAKRAADIPYQNKVCYTSRAAVVKWQTQQIS
jgi:hypothetical protein